MKILVFVLSLGLLHPALADDPPQLTLAQRIAAITEQTSEEDRMELVRDLISPAAHQHDAIAASINGLSSSQFEVVANALATMNDNIFIRINGSKFTGTHLNAIAQLQTSRRQRLRLLTAARNGQVASLSVEAIASLTPATLNLLADTQLQALTPSQIAATTRAQWDDEALRNRLKALPATSFAMSNAEALALRARLAAPAPGIDLTGILTGEQLTAWNTAVAPAASAARTEDAPRPEDPPAQPQPQTIFSGRTASDCRWVAEIPRRVIYANEPSCGRRNNPIKTCVGYVSCAGPSASSPRLIRMTTCDADLCNDNSAAGALRCTRDQTRYSRQPTGEREEPGINLQLPSASAAGAQ